MKMMDREIVITVNIMTKISFFQDCICFLEGSALLNHFSQKPDYRYIRVTHRPVCAWSWPPSGDFKSAAVVQTQDKVCNL